MIYRLMIMLLLLPGLLWAEPLDRVIAVVNKNVITARELNQQVEQMRKQMTAQGIQIASDQILRKQALDQLINLDLQLQLAKKNNLTVEAAEIDAAAVDIAKRNHLSLAQLREALQAQGMSWNAYRDDIKRELLISRVQQKAIHFEAEVPKKQIDAYLKTLKPDPAQSVYHLFNIVVPVSEEPTESELNQAKQKAYGVLAELRGGRDFKTIAFSESSGRFVLESNDLGERHLSELPEVFAKAVIQMKKGDIAGPIRTGNGYQLIKLIDVRGEAAPQDPALLRQQAKQQILQRNYVDALQNWLH